MSEVESGTVSEFGGASELSTVPGSGARSPPTLTDLLRLGRRGVLDFLFMGVSDG